MGEGASSDTYSDDGTGSSNYTRTHLILGLRVTASNKYYENECTMEEESREKQVEDRPGEQTRETGSILPLDTDQGFRVQ